MASFCLDFYKGTDLYSDGDIENEIVEYIRASDKDVEKIFEKDSRWPVFYYLSQIRNNLLSWYEFAPEADVLEIGAGFGAVTSVLCEKCRSVTAVELSRRRAEGLYERYKDKKNLDIFVGNFNDMQFDKQFDYITLIGVLEYACSFTSAPLPFEAFLEKIRGLLKPGGKLLIAIENRFGLKYWCGAAEDHTGQPFDGVSGYENVDFVKTFSRADLKLLLARSGFSYTDFYYPYPDYKLPQVVYSDRFLPQPCDAAKVREFYLEAKLFTAQERKIIQDIAANDVFPFFSNSFFVEAAVEAPKEQRKLCAAFFGYDRKEEYRIGTAIYSDGTVLKYPVSPKAQVHIDNVHNNYLRLLTSGIRILDENLRQCGIVSRFIEKPTLKQVLYELVQKGDTKTFFVWVDRFFENILSSGHALSGSGIDTVLEQGYPDMIFSNCFVDGEELLFFDQEWAAETVTAGYVLSRALKHFFIAFPNKELEIESYRHFGFENRHFEEYDAAEKVFNTFVIDPVISQYLDAHTFRYEKKIGQILADNEAQLHRGETEVAELTKQKQDVTQLYYDTLSYAKGLENNPELLGKKRILKAFIKAFLPHPMLSAGRRMLSACRKVKQGRRSSGLKYEQWIKNSAVRANEYQKLEKEPLFSILVPLYNTDKKMLEEMIVSCLGQTYPHFELCLLDASDEAHGYVYETAEAFAAKDARIKLKKAENLGIAGNTNACRAMAGGEYLALLDHDDCLTKNALYAMAKAINEQAPDVLYSDEDHLKGGRRYLPFFKPDFNRDLLYSQMYICHFLAFKAELFDAVGQMREEYSGSQDYDLMLRLSEKTDAICHIPDILYSWRETETSTSVNPGAKPYAHEAGRKALDEHLKRRYGAGAHAEESDYLFVYDARFDTLKDEPLLSVIIPTKDHAPLLKACVESILEKTSYSNFEVLILDNNSEEETTFACFKELQEKDARVRVIEARFPFNWSKLNNFGIQHSRGEVLVFLNNDTVVLSPDWLERLAENALRPDVGAVGALLLYEDDTIQHAGVVVGMNGWADHVYKGMPQKHAADMFVSPMVSRDVAAVTGACMAVSRRTLQQVGPFDESFIVCGSDVEFCLRAQKKGLETLYNARVRLYHMESKTRDASDIPPVDFVRSEEVYREFRENGDPYYNKNLDSTSVVPQIKV